MSNRREFPDEATFARMFCDTNSTFVDQEDVNWDFKDQWPFSYSDDYFFGIIRLMAAFANTSGGFIIFGVHDEKRTAGHNKVKPNTDRLRQAIISMMSQCPDFQIRHYDIAAIGEVDCMLIRPRQMG
jgi:hypothetical protein